MKIILSLSLLLILVNGFSQNSNNVTVHANNVRVFAKPLSKAVIPNTFLKWGEKVRLIDVVIQDRQEGGSLDLFLRMYRNGDNKTPYYLNIAEIDLNAKTPHILPSSDAIVKETVINKVWVPNRNTFHKKGDVLFFDGKNSSGIYSFLNKAALSKSDVVNTQFTGFYLIENIIKSKVENIDKVFFDCKPLKTPFNGQKNNNIYIDFFSAKDNIDFQSLSYKNYFLNLMLTYAYKFPNGEVPIQFYTDYLTSLYGEQTISQWDEFKRQKIYTSSKLFMDSIYNERSNVFNILLSDVYYSRISEYNFNTGSFKILNFSDGNETLDQLKITKGLQSWPRGNTPFYGLVNISFFAPDINMKIDSAELFSNEIKTYSVDNTNRRFVVLIPHYKYIPIEKAKALDKEHNLKLGNFENQKQIDFIEVYSGEILSNKFIYGGKESKKSGQPYIQNKVE